MPAGTSCRRGARPGPGRPTGRACGPGTRHRPAAARRRPRVLRNTAISGRDPVEVGRRPSPSARPGFPCCARCRRRSTGAAAARHRPRGPADRDPARPRPRGRRSPAGPRHVAVFLAAVQRRGAPHVPPADDGDAQRPPQDGGQPGQGTSRWRMGAWSHANRTPRSGHRTPISDGGQPRLHWVGLRPIHLQVASLSSVALCIGLWIRAKTVDQDERGNAERRALFAGLWPPTLWLIWGFDPGSRNGVRALLLGQTRCGSSAERACVPGRSTTTRRWRRSTGGPRATGTSTRPRRAHRAGAAWPAGARRGRSRRPACWCAALRVQ